MKEWMMISWNPPVSAFGTRKRTTPFSVAKSDTCTSSPFSFFKTRLGKLSPMSIGDKPPFPFSSPSISSWSYDFACKQSNYKKIRFVKEQKWAPHFSGMNLGHPLLQRSLSLQAILSLIPSESSMSLPALLLRSVLTFAVRWRARQRQRRFSKAW